ncbi:MAG: sensor histidine kinase [Eubacterium sp.]
MSKKTTAEKKHRKMKPSLMKKILIGYLAFAIMGFVSILAISPNIMYSTLFDKQVSDMRNEASKIASDYLSSPNSDEQLSLIAALLNYDLWIIDTQNKIVFDSSNSFTESTIPDFNLKDFNSKHYLTGTFYDLFNDNTLSVIHPIVKNDNTTGYVILNYPLSSIQKSAYTTTYTSYIAYGVIILFSLILFIIFMLFIYNPIKNVSEAATEFAKGNFARKDIVITSHDEIGDLANSLNKMKNQLNETEEYQRKFISNISHDFRSPLTSIRGYIEAMLDGTIPPENYEKYLSIVLSETERLSGLSNGLIELGNWGTSTIKLEYEDFVITETIDKIMGIFEGRCEAKNIHLEANYPRQFMVNADMKKIEQVLYNLVDNAIKFSKDNSKIEINLANADDKVLITVKDYGVGIPQESIGKIWDRFYKTDSSRGLDKSGSGIGLAIVKEILLAHDEEITVNSKEGEGTEFTFSLKKAKRQMY